MTGKLVISEVLFLCGKCFGTRCGADIFRHPICASSTDNTPPAEFVALADSTVVFQNAIDAMATFGGGTVYVPAGLYKISALVLPSRVQLVGEGVGITRLRQLTHIATPMIATKNFASDSGTENIGQTNFAIRDMSLEGTEQLSGTINAYGAVSLYGYDFEVSRVHILGFNANGLWTEWGGTLPDEDRYYKQPASFTDLTLSENWRCGWIHLGPHDSMAARINSFSNGREHTAGGASLNNTGESNIWIARRIGPVAYVEKIVRGGNTNIRISTPGSGYTPGVFAVVKSGNSIGLLGHVIVSEDAEQKAIGINWIYKNSNFEGNGPVDIGFLGDVGDGGSLPVAKGTVSGLKITSLNFTGTGLSPGSKLPAWPKININYDSTAPTTPAAVIPVLRGGQIHAAIVLNSGAEYTGQVTCEVVQGANSSAIGVVFLENGRVTRILFGNPGCLMNAKGSADKAKVVVQSGTAPNVFKASSEEFNRFGEVTTWEIDTPNVPVGHQARLDYSPADTSVKKMSPMEGGMLLDQSHAWGAQTYGIRVSATAVLTGCEAEGHYGANMFLEANTGIVTGAWIYDSGDKKKGPGGAWGEGSNTAVGIHIGHAGSAEIPPISGNKDYSPSQWQISGRIENCHAGGLVNFAEGDAIQTDLVINNICGLFHFGYTKLAGANTELTTPYTLDEAVSAVTANYDDLRIAAFYGEGNFYRYKRATRASISTSRFQQFNFTADTETRLDQPITKLRFYGYGGRFMFDFSLSTSGGFWLPAFNAASGSTRGINANSSGNGFFGADAFYFRNFQIVTVDTVYTSANFVSSVRAEPPETTTITITLPLIDSVPISGTPLPTTFRVFNAGPGFLQLAAAVGEVIDPLITDRVSTRTVKVQKETTLELISTTTTATRSWVLR